MWHLQPGPDSCLAVVLFLLPLTICYIPCPSVLSLSVLLAMRPMVWLTCHNVFFLSVWYMLELPGSVFLPLVMGIKVLVRRESRRWAGEGSPSLGMLCRLSSATYTSVPSWQKSHMRANSWNSLLVKYAALSVIICWGAPWVEKWRFSLVIMVALVMFGSWSISNQPEYESTSTRIPPPPPPPLKNVGCCKGPWQVWYNSVSVSGELRNADHGVVGHYQLWVHFLWHRIAWGHVAASLMS